MAKKNKNSVVSTKPVIQSGNGPVRSTATVSTPVRNSPVPKVAQQASRKQTPTHEQISKRAYEIWQSGQGGSQDEHWYRALRELGGGQ